MQHFLTKTIIQQNSNELDERRKFNTLITNSFYLLQEFLYLVTIILKFKLYLYYALLLKYHVKKYYFAI